MNKIYRSVWSQYSESWVAVPECVRGNSKTGIVAQVGAMSVSLLTRYFSVTAVAAAACLAGGPSWAQPIVVSGDNTILYAPHLDYPNYWMLTGDMVVGQAGMGMVVVGSGGYLSGNIPLSVNAVIGRDAGSSGLILVTGVDANWDIGPVKVGEYGSGIVNIENGGHVFANSSWGVGVESGGVGETTVTGTNSQLYISGDLTVGAGGQGTLSIEDGGRVRASRLDANSTIPNPANSPLTSVISITGSGSLLELSGSAVIGTMGSGEVNIENGGRLSAGGAFTIASSSAGHGSVNVKGPGSFMSTHDFLMAAGNTSLSMEDGSSMVTGRTSIGSLQAGVAQAVVKGPGTLLDTGPLFVGEWGNGTLAIENGAVTKSVYGVVGAGPVMDLGSPNKAGTGGVTVKGVGSTWDLSMDPFGRYLTIGKQGNGTLSIESGGLVRTNKVTLAEEASSDPSVSPGSVGNLHVLGDASAGRGVLEASKITAGQGTATLDLNGGILRARANEVDFLSHIPSVDIGANGAFIDTNGHNIGVATAFSSTAGAGLTKQGQGVLTLTGINAYAGGTTVENGTLRTGAANVLSPTSVHTVASGATLDLAGFNQTVAGLNNSGTVNLVSAMPGTMLTVNGPYVGNGGLLNVSTVLGADGSPSSRMLLNGPTAVASGTTTIQVGNAGGLGAQTTGRGIEVVGTANGASLLPTTFMLAGGHVDAGAYEYYLEQDGLGASLHSRYMGSDQAVAYRNEVPLLSALPEQVRQADLAMLGDMHKRVGDDALPGTGGALGVQGNRHAWGRIMRTDPKIRQQGTVNQDSSGHLTGFQAGVDLYADAHFKTGLYVGQLTGDMGVRGFAGGEQNKYVGFNDLRTRSIGWYGTWQDGAGFYADLVMQKSNYRVTSHSVDGITSTSKGEGFLTSLELGKSFALGGRWQVEPQVQIVYRLTDMDDSNISLAKVTTQTDNDWLLRLGGRIKGNFATSAGVLQPYGRMNLYKAGGGSDTSSFITPAAKADIQSRKGYTSSELAVGATLQTSPGVSLYGELGRVWSNGGPTRLSSGLQASLGVKMSW